MNKRFNSIFTNKLLALIAFTLGIFLVSCAGVKDSQKADMTFRLSALRQLPFDPDDSYNNARYIVSAKSANYSKTLTFSFMEMGNYGLKPVENIIAKFDDVPVEESLTVSMVLAIPDSYKVPEFSGIYQIDNPALNSEEIRENNPEDNPDAPQKNFYFKPAYSASKTFTTKAGENFVNLKFEKQNNSLVIDQAKSNNFMANEFSELKENCPGLVFDYVYFQNDIGLAVIKVQSGANNTPESYYSNQNSKWKSTSQTLQSANARVYIDSATSDVYMLFCGNEKIEIDNSSIYTLVIKKLSSDQSIAKAYAGKIWADTNDPDVDYSYYYFENESTVHTGNYTPDGEEQISPSGKYKASFFKAAELTLLAIGPNVYEVSEPTPSESETLTFTMKETGSSDDAGGTPLYDITAKVENQDSYKFQTINIASGLYLDTTYNRYLLVNENGTAIAGRGMFFKEALEKFNANKNSYMANLRTPVGTTAEDKRNYAKSSPVKFKEIMQTYAPVYGPLAGLEGSLNASLTKININGTAFSYSYDPNNETITVKPSSNYNPFSNVTTDPTTGETPNITLTKVDASFSKFWHDLKAGKCYIYNASTDAAEERKKLVFNTPLELTKKIGEDISGESDSDIEKPVLVFIDKYDGYQVDTDSYSGNQFHFEGKSQKIGSTYINKDIYIDGNNLSITNSYVGSNTDESSTFSSNAANLHLLNMELYGNTSATNQHGVQTKTSDVYLHNTKIKGFTATKGSAVLAGVYNDTNGNHNHGIFVCDTNVLIGGKEGDENTTTGSSTNNYGGALHAPYVFMLDGTVSYNTATGTTGGGIWADDFIMVGGTVSNNSAESGGGVYVKSRAHLFNGDVTYNTAEQYGAGIFIDCTQTDDYETTSEIGMIGNPDDWDLNVSYNSILTSGTDAIGVGAGLAFTNVKTTIFYGTFNNNPIIDNTGLLAGTGGAIGIKNGATAQITIAGGTFSGNKAKNGGVFGDSSNNTNRLFVTGGTFQNNQAADGGVIYTACSTTSTSMKNYTEISGGTFDSNTATNNGGIIYKIAKCGDGLGITGGKFTNNTAYENGGAIYIIPSNGNYPASTIYVGGKLDGNKRIEEGSNDTIKFVSNKSKNGGAIYIDSKSGSFDIQTTIFCGTFKDNGGIFDNIETKCSTVNGGAIYNKKQLYIYSPLFDGNSVLGTADENPSGAAIYIDGTENNNACVRFDKFNSCLFGNETPNLKKIYKTIDDTNYDKNCSDVHWKYNNTDPEKNIRSLFDSSYSSMAETYVTTIFKDYGEHQETISFEKMQ